MRNKTVYVVAVKEKEENRSNSVDVCLYSAVQSFTRIPWEIWLCKYLLVARFENEENATGQTLKH